jgi:hypothetical protein
MKWIAAIKLVMITGLLVFYLFWYLPNMKRIHAEREELDSHFNASEDCWNGAMNRKDYVAASDCSERFLEWEATRNTDKYAERWGW